LRRLAVIFALIISVFSVYGQKNDNITYNFFTGYGLVARTNDFMDGENVDSTKINRVTSFAFEISKQVDGSKSWHYLHRKMRYGVGLYHGIFNYSKNINNPWGLYAFMGFMPIENERWQLRTDIALGISGIWDGFSSENNYNIAVSTPIEAYIHARINLLYNINPNWHLGVSGAFIHFSNGCIKRPNKGINIITPLVNLAYNPKQINKVGEGALPKYEKTFQRLITFYDAKKGIYADYTKSLNHYTNDTIRDTIRDVHWIFGLQYREMYTLSRSHSIGWGMDLSYNTSIHRTYGWQHYTPKFSEGFDIERFTVSAFFSYEYFINKLSFVVEPIVYLYKPHKTYFTRFAQRIGLRYQFYKGWYYQLVLRAYGFTRADYIEGGVGYRFQYKRK
jgi:hypothetical protein